MDRPTTDPFPLATDWQAVARTIANVVYFDSPSYSMDYTYFSHPLPQIINALVYSVMTGTFHDGFGSLVRLRRTKKAVLLYESNQEFKDTKGDIYKKYDCDFQQYFLDHIKPYFRERLLNQCDVDLKISLREQRIAIHHTSDTVNQCRANVLAYLVNRVIFPTLLGNGLTNAANTLARLLVVDYRLPLEFLTHKPDLPEQKGKKLELAGLKFGRLHVVKERAARSKGGHVKWDCVCDCGAPVLGVSSSDLTKWRRFSCGLCYPKAISESTLENATLRAKQAYNNARVSSVKRAKDYADKVLSREFNRNLRDANYENDLYTKGVLARDKIMMLAGPAMVLHVAGLPILPLPKKRTDDEEEGRKKDGLDLHRAGHEIGISRGPMMPYASSTICWVSSKLNRAHLADCTIEPYRDSPPKELKAGKPDETEASDLL